MSAHLEIDEVTFIRKPYPYEHLRKTVSGNLKIDKATFIGASLSTGTSPSTKSTAPLNPEINSEKYEYLY
jgi:hypothetical protein